MPLNNRSPIGSGENRSALVRLNTETSTFLSSRCFCSDNTPKPVTSFWFSFNVALSKLVTPLTLRPSVV